MKVREIMTSKSLRYCTPQTKLHIAAKSMKTRNCGALPVVDKDKKVVGIITDRDICLFLVLKQGTPFIKNTVGQIMPSKIHTVRLNDDISAAFRIMRTNQISRLPVVDENGKLRGIVSIHNLINTSFINGRQGLGDIYSSGENLSKTIMAVTDKYNSLNAGQSLFFEPVITQNPENDFTDDLYVDIAELQEEY